MVELQKGFECAENVFSLDLVVGNQLSIRPANQFHRYDESCFHIPNPEAFLHVRVNSSLFYSVFISKHLNMSLLRIR